MNASGEPALPYERHGGPGDGDERCVDVPSRRVDDLVNPNETRRDTLQPSVLPLDERRGEAPASRTGHAGTPWGPWSTIGFGLLVVALWIAAQGAAMAILAGRGAKASDVMARGWLLAWITMMGAPVMVGGAVLMARLRKGIRVAAYLGLERPRAAHASRWLPIALGLVAASDLLSWARGRPVVPELMIPAFQTAEPLPLLLIALVVVAPLGEEFLFRGFLLPGLLGSRLGPSGAIAVTAVAWAGLHFQYDLYGMATVAASGVLLGVVRWRTGSLWMCALVHALMNAIACVEVLVILWTS
jgi:CAAX protease family protein